MYRGLKDMKGTKDKLRYVFMPPGWKPDYITTSDAPLNVTTYKKFDTIAPSSINYYVLFQYAITLGGATLFLLNAKNLLFVDKFIACGLIILSIVNYSNLFESKKYAVTLEAIRLILISGSLVIFFHLQSTTILIAIASWLIISGFWLFKIKQIK
jgi:alkylglycerol monooxygenase